MLEPLCFPASLNDRLVALQCESRSIIEEPSGSRMARLQTCAVFLAPAAASTGDRLRWLLETLGGGALEPVMREEAERSGVLIPKGSKAFSMKDSTHALDFNYFGLAGGNAAGIDKGAPLLTPSWTAELGHWNKAQGALAEVVERALERFCAATPERRAISFMGPQALAGVCAEVASQIPQAAPRPSAAARAALAAPDAVPPAFDPHDLLAVFRTYPAAQKVFLARLASGLEARELALESGLSDAKNNDQATDSARAARWAARL